MEHERLTDAIKSVAWGYLLLLVNFNLGTLNILPNWLGYVLMLKALPALGEEEPSALLLRPLGTLLALWEGVVWGLAIFGGSFDSTVISIIAAVLGLYFHFQLLTNIANIAKSHDCTEQGRILTLRTVRTVLLTLSSLPLAWERYTAFTIGMVIVNLIVAIWICSVLFSLRNSLEGPATNDLEE